MEKRENERVEHNIEEENEKKGPHHARPSRSQERTEVLHQCNFISMLTAFFDLFVEKK